ncbi:toprim domain-containing protein [Aureliella helgolandensis]|uniref:hypothetical protein n=1 Tax=Aureliella helgolandensis TaxID=2527968 RepID=UPI00119F99E9|nr:hypothetical protein [Aureliella helgolandensis]
MKSDAIIGAIQSVTKGWAKQRKAEERGSRRPRGYYYSNRVNFSDIAHQILPDAYQHASGNGRFPVSQRQMYYASREKFRELTGREIDAAYFSQTILRKYLNTHTVDWKITADPRGTFTVPNANNEVRIPVGTLSIDRYLRDRTAVSDLQHISLPTQWPSIAENERYAAVLYIEKEGFEPLLNEAKIAERFDLAILSCKGQSVAAARQLVDHVCRVDGGVPLFVVHDFDEAGFQIASCLTSESEYALDNDRVAYHFQHQINVTDFGLRLADVEEYSLASEKVKYRNICLENVTSEEVSYLRSGRRVELNAFTAPEFIGWLEGKLKGHLPMRLVPDIQVLEAAYRRAIAVRRANQELIQSLVTAREEAIAAQIPENLKSRVANRIATKGETWDMALYQLAVEEHERD